MVPLQMANRETSDTQSATGLEIERFIARSRALDLSGIAWRRVAHYPLSPEAIRWPRPFSVSPASPERRCWKPGSIARSGVGPSRVHPLATTRNWRESL